MTKFILVASTDKDAVDAAEKSTKDDSDYWYNAEILNLDDGITSKYKVEAALEAAQHNPFGSLENIAIISHSNNQKIGDANGSMSWTDEQFASLLETVVPSAYIPSTYTNLQKNLISNDVGLSFKAGVFFSIIYGDTRFELQLCVQLDLNKELNGLWIYTSSMPISTKVPSPADSVWQSCQVSYSNGISRISNNAAKTLKWTADVTDKQNIDKASCSSINALTNTYLQIWDEKLLNVVMHTDTIKMHIVSVRNVLPTSVQCILNNDKLLSVIVNSSIYKKFLCVNDKNLVRDFILFENKTIELGGKSVADFITEQLSKFCENSFEL